jgi:hypothetical protein
MKNTTTKGKSRRKNLRKDKERQGKQNCLMLHLYRPENRLFTKSEGFSPTCV